jgi:hypothetical protein
MVQFFLSNVRLSIPRVPIRLINTTRMPQNTTIRKKSIAKSDVLENVFYNHFGHTHAQAAGKYFRRLALLASQLPVQSTDGEGTLTLTYQDDTGIQA